MSKLIGFILFGLGMSGGWAALKGLFTVASSFIDFLVMGVVLMFMTILFVVGAKLLFDDGTRK